MTPTPPDHALRRTRWLFTILSISAVIAVLCGVLVAQSWGDDCVYQNKGGYFVLGAVLLFAISPYAGLALFSRLFTQSSAAFRVFVLGASCIGIGGSIIHFAAIADSDAQGGLVLVPVVQWADVLLLLVVCAAVRWLSSTPAAKP